MGWHDGRLSVCRLSRMFRVRQKKVAPKVFRCFLSDRLEFKLGILHVYL